MNIEYKFEGFPAFSYYFVVLKNINNNNDPYMWRLPKARVWLAGKIFDKLLTIHQICKSFPQSNFYTIR